MSLRRISVENFRCFAGRQDVELSPITVIMGKNNIGKSALLRTPMVAATGINTRSPLPFDLARLGGNAPRFVDLIHMRLEVGNITVGLEFADEIGRLELEATIQNMTDWDTQVVSKWALRSAESHAALDWRPPVDAVADQVPRSYRFSIDSRPPATVEVSFEGLLPVAFAQSGQFPESISGHLRRVHNAFDTIRYLSAFRTPPARKLQLQASQPDPDESGSTTGEALIHDHVYGGHRLIEQINQYLGSYFPGWEVEVAPQFDGYSVGLKSTRTRGLWVPGTDTGTGVSQVLPILLRRAQDDLDPPVHPVLEIVEEPELHLHPAAQAPLADLYVTAAQQSNVRFLIETHSETFLLRLRRRIAEQALSPETVAVYFVDETPDGSATVRRIRLDEYGRVDYWPEGIFAEDFEEVRAMAEAQGNRLDPDAS
jgi:AAA ATPase-like protein/uncharacterized protein DUF3696